LGTGTQIIADESYNFMLETFLKSERTFTDEVSKNYQMMDYGFMQKLEAAIGKEKDTETLTKLNEIKEAVSAEMATRMQDAANAMKDIIQSPSPVVMEGKIKGLARQGRLDDALVQLLQANLEQAQAAGEQGKGAVQVLGKLLARIRVELDQKLKPEVALLRQLMRMDSVEARKELLREKMAPQKESNIDLSLELSTVSSVSELAEKPKTGEAATEPQIKPRDLAAALTEIKARFGNVDENYNTGFITRLNTISEEAELIALELAGGKEITAKEAQDLAWTQKTVSVWDLEAIEEEAHQNNQMAVWEDEAQQQMARQEEASRRDAVQADWGS
jgi:hypothetical protein